MDNRYEIAEQNGMSREFADWFFDNKKAGCGNVWFMTMAAMWEGWQGRAEMFKNSARVKPSIDAGYVTNNPSNCASVKVLDDTCRTTMLQGADDTFTNEDAKRVGELVMWVKRLAHSLRKANPDSKLQSDAMDYLSRKGLIGVKDILR